MELNLDSVTIIHNEKLHRFEATVDGLTSIITYIRSPGRIVYNHTEVPPQLEGNGLAGKLTQTALDYARSNRLRVVAQCPYVAGYIGKHPEYQDLLAAEESKGPVSQK